MTYTKWLLQRLGISRAAETLQCKSHVPPHERWPEIMHWKKDDVFELVNAYCGEAFLHSITENGSAYVIEGVSPSQGHPEKWDISSLVGHNRSLRSRQVTTEMQHSNEYMELIEEFNRAFEKLQERDMKNGIAE